MFLNTGVPLVIFTADFVRAELAETEKFSCEPLSNSYFTHHIFSGESAQCLGDGTQLRATRLVRQPVGKL